MKPQLTLLLLPLLMTCSRSGAAQVAKDNVVQRDADAALETTIRSLVASSNGVSWIAWDVLSNEPHAYMCCFNSIDEGEKHQWRGGSCTLDEDASFISNHPGASEGSATLEPTRETFTIFLRVNNHTLDRARMFSSDCRVEAGNLTVTKLANVDMNQSVAMMEKLIDTMGYVSKGSRHKKDERQHLISALASHRSSLVVPALEKIVRSDRDDDLRGHAAFWLGMKGGEAGRNALRQLLESPQPEHLQEQAVAGIAQDESQAAIDLLLQLARQHRDPEVRKRAIFWLGQRAGEKATAGLKEAANDENEDVQEMAVFSISQLPKERSIPELISLARTHKSKAVRERAIFWLGQSGDERALDFIEEVLTK